MSRLLLMRSSSRKWLSFLLPSQEEEQTVLRDAGMSTAPNAQEDVTSQAALPMPSPPASPPPALRTSAPLRRLLDETSDLIDSPMFTHVLTLLLDASFSQLVDVRLRSEAYKLPPLTTDPSPAARITEVTDDDPVKSSIKLATVLAFMTREAHKIGNGVPNQYVQATEAVSEMEGFAAVVYSSNFELEAGLETVTTPDASKSRSGDELSTQVQEDILVADANGTTDAEPAQGYLDKATGVIDTAFGGFNSVWNRVTGRDTSL